MRQILIIGVEGRQIRAERDACGTRQRCHVDHQVRRIFVRIGQRIGQNKTAFSVGIVDLHRQPLAAAVDIAGAEGIGGDGVFDRGHENAKIDRQLRIHDHQRKAEHIGSTSHILLHQRHGSGGFDIETAGIEAHTLAHQCQPRITLLAPVHLQKARCAFTGATDRMDQREVFLEQIIAGGDLHLRLVMGGKRAEGNLELIRPHVVGRNIDEVARKENTGQNALAQVKAFDDALSLTGLIVTKLDGTAKGGILAAIARQRPVPVYFIGVGEKVEDLQPFNAEEFADALLG